MPEGIGASRSEVEARDMKAESRIRYAPYAIITGVIYALLVFKQLDSKSHEPHIIEGRHRMI